MSKNLRLIILVGFIVAISGVILNNGSPISIGLDVAMLVGAGIISVGVAINMRASKKTLVDHR